MISFQPPLLCLRLFQFLFGSDRINPPVAPELNYTRFVSALERSLTTIRGFHVSVFAAFPVGPQHIPILPQPESPGICGSFRTSFETRYAKMLNEEGMKALHPSRLAVIHSTAAELDCKRKLEQ
jgi:hypothetical protein